MAPARGARRAPIMSLPNHLRARLLLALARTIMSGNTNVIICALPASRIRAGDHVGAADIIICGLACGSRSGLVG